MRHEVDWYVANYVPIAFAGDKSNDTVDKFDPRRLFLMRLPEAPSLDQRIREAAERYGRVEDLKLLG